MSELENKDRTELFTRRIADEVSRSVEATLRWRYSWIGIVLAFILGGLGYGIVTAVVKDASENITRANLLLGNANDQLKNANKQLESVDALTKQKLAELDQFISAASKRIQSFDAEMKEVESLLAARQLDLKNLNDTARRIEELSGQLVEMNAMVAELARTIEESGLNAASGAGYTAALARQSSEITEIREQTKSVVQRIATSRISVYVHFPRSEGDLPNRILRVVNRIEALGYPVPDTRAVANVRSLNEVRYYHAEDRDAAEKLAADTSLVLKMEGAESTAVEVRDFTNWASAKPRRGVVELWL